VCACVDAGGVYQAAERFISDSLSRVTMHTDAVEAVRDAELVIEAIVENLESKQQLFATLDTAAPRSVEHCLCCNVPLCCNVGLALAFVNDSVL